MTISEIKAYIFCNNAQQLCHDLASCNSNISYNVVYVIELFWFLLLEAEIHAHSKWCKDKKQFSKESSKIMRYSGTANLSKG